MSTSLLDCVYPSISPPASVAKQTCKFKVACRSTALVKQDRREANAQKQQVGLTRPAKWPARAGPQGSGACLNVILKHVLGLNAPKRPGPESVSRGVADIRAISVDNSRTFPDLRNFFAGNNAFPGGHRGWRLTLDAELTSRRPIGLPLQKSAQASMIARRRSKLSVRR